MSPATTRYAGATAATLVLGAIGLANASGTLLIAAALPLLYVGVAAVGRPVEPEGLRARRQVEPGVIGPGELATVELRVENEGARPVPDLRIVDGVPPDLAVVEGSPRAARALEPGESLTVRYTLVARRGEYEFDPVRVRSRNATATRVETTTLDPEGDARLSCRLDAGAPPLAESGAGFVGRRRAAEPGRGIEFHSTREYRRSDAADRIDWRHYAKRGELATVDYERRVSATVVLVLDARPVSRAAAGPARPDGLELGAYAASRSLATLLANGEAVGVAVVGREGDGPAGLEWLAPASGPRQRRRGLDVIRRAARAERDGAPNRLQEQCHRLAEHAPVGAQVVVFSPLLDDQAVDALETVVAAGRPTTVLSPDVLAANTASGRIDSIQRRTRLHRCQTTGVRTVDWRRGAPLSVVLEAALDVGAGPDRGSTTTRAVGGDT